MIKDLWINLPVKNVSLAKEFFTQIGFSLNAKYSKTDQSACVTAGDKNVVVMLFEENTFKGATRNVLPNSKETTEVLISLSAESHDEIDEMANKVFNAGGRIFSEPQEIQGWMYGFGFADLDDHRWNVLYMDMSKMTTEEK